MNNKEKFAIISFNCKKNAYSNNPDGRDTYLGYKFISLYTEKEILKTIRYVLSKLKDYGIPNYGLSVDATNNVHNVSTTESIDREIEETAHNYMPEKDIFVK